MSATLDTNDPAELAERSTSFESSWAGDIVRWAAETYGAGLVATASFEDAVLPHLVATAAPGTEVAFLDTQYHFAETWWLVEEVRVGLGERLNLTIERPLPDVRPDNLWQQDVEACCARRKVEPLQRVLGKHTAWITGIRRVDGPTRADAPIVSWDERFEVVKINPLATWSDEDLRTYVSVNELPQHPLRDKGDYPSIGCWPCTRPVAPGEDRRAGRWAGSAKTECGLHG